MYVTMSNPIFTPTTPHFFQPLLPGFHHHLSIPLSFFKYYLKDQINRERSAVLKSYGRSWSVKIKDRRFEDGWEEFARDHDLHVGDFLVFGYGGDMVFDVVVFDTSACQRECKLLASKEKEPAKTTGINVKGSVDSASRDYIAKKKEKRALLDAFCTPLEKRVKWTDAAANEESSKSTDGSTLFDWAMRNWPVTEIEGVQKMSSSQVLQSSVSLLMQAISMQLGVHNGTSDVEALIKEKEELELKFQTLEGEFKAMKEQLESAQKERDIENEAHNEELKKAQNRLEEERAKRLELKKSLEKEHMMKTQLMEQIDNTGDNYRKWTLFEVQLQYGPLNFSETPFELLHTPPDDFDVLNPSEEDLQQVRISTITTTAQEAVRAAVSG